jgi:hypothetical protein
MKKIILSLLCGIITIVASAQEGNKRTRTVADRDTVEIKVNGEKKKVKIIFETGEDVIDRDINTDTLVRNKPEIKSTSKSVKNSKLFAGITFSRFDLGLAKMVDNGKGNLSPENEFLDYRAWKSVNVGFDVAQIGYKFNDQFRMLLAAGFDWTHFRLNKDIIIKEDTHPLEYENSTLHYSKNRFSSSYLRIPLTFEIRSKAGTFEERLRFAAGPIAGILIQGSQKFKSKEEGKTKNIDDYNYTPFRYGAFARVGYGSFGLYAKYYFNDMFQNSPAQEGLRNVSFGAMFFF